MVAELVGMAVAEGKRTAAVVLGMDDALDGEGSEGKRGARVGEADVAMPAAQSVAAEEKAISITSPGREPMEM
jgi:hypothetical protein